MEKTTMKCPTMKIALLCCVAGVTLSACGGGGGGDGAVATSTPTSTIRATVAPTLTATTSLIATPTQSPTATSTLIPTQVLTATLNPTETASATALTSTATPTATVVFTATPTSSATLVPTSGATPTSTTEFTATATATPTPTATENGVLSVSDAVARDADGTAIHLGQTITTEGVLTVAAGIFANNKLKVFAQEGGAGIMVYHQSSANVDAFQTGQRLRATGVVRQQDPTSDANPAIGTVAVDISQGSVSVVSDGNPLPDPQSVTLATLNANGTSYTGILVRVTGVQKVSGTWPAAGSKSTQVQISDDGGPTQAVLRLQRNTITQQLVTKLNAIGDGSFTLTGIVVQDDATNDGKLLSGFEIWLRGADDVVAP